MFILSVLAACQVGVGVFFIAEKPKVSKLYDNTYMSCDSLVNEKIDNLTILLNSEKLYFLRLTSLYIYAFGGYSGRVLVLVGKSS